MYLDPSLLLVGAGKDFSHGRTRQVVILTSFSSCWVDVMHWCIIHSGDDAMATVSCRLFKRCLPKHVQTLHGDVDMNSYCYKSPIPYKQHIHIPWNCVTDHHHDKRWKREKERLRKNSTFGNRLDRILWIKYKRLLLRGGTWNMDMVGWCGWGRWCIWRTWGKRSNPN